MKSALTIVFSFILLILSGHSQILDDYRSNVATGTWAAAGSWQRFDGTSWVAAVAAPTAATAQNINIRNGHNITIGAAVSIDQTVVDVGGTITWSTGILTVANGAGTDLIINGTFIDNSTSNVAFTGAPTGAKWQLAPGATYVKQRNGSAVNWRDNYEGGMINIPATSNWIIRKTAVGTPTFTTVGGTYYGNFIIENTSATFWTMTTTATFTGSTGFPTIKGNFDIGNTTSTAGISFLNDNTNATPTLVQGDMIVRAGNTYRNFGTGTEIQGNLTNAGTISYDATDGRLLSFTGANIQSITNTGVLGIYNFTINKSANSLTLNNPITIDNLATFQNGVVNSTATNLFILNTAATVNVIPTTSFVNGPARRLGGLGITFPVGKGTTYRPIGIGNSSSMGGTFWTETFGTASCAARGTLANGFNSGNGAWTQTNGANGSLANEWYVSPTEANMGSGVCSDGCVSNGALTNSTLHLSAVGGLCGTPDCGSAYDATNGNNITDKRVESPVINCSGQTGITLSFLYIGNGQTTLDNTIIWYFDGISWNVLFDPNASGLCGAFCGLGICQGVWTPLSIALPASADNNPNVRIGFQWVNNGDGIGSDPSFGVDDITLSSSNPSIFTAEYFPSNPQIPYGNLLVPTLTNLSDCEYWILDRNAGTDSRTVTLSWNAASCYNTAFASFEVARYDGISTWQDHDGTVAGTAAGGTVTTPAVVSSFGPFAIAYVPLPLPIELINFNGECKDGKVKLYWQTSSEINNDYFTIERSADMVEWEEIKRIPGAGNSNSVLSYETIDFEPQLSNYYRLKQTDYNGETEIFNAIFVECLSLQNGLNIFPNPTSGILNIDVPNGSVIHSVEVINSLGQPVMQLGKGDQKGGTIYTLDISQLSSGAYYIRILLNDEWITKPVNLIR